jgi:BirA family biotin operon repressor/biotin-[acetyl-CoA-carboxylase] ligase
MNRNPFVWSQAESSAEFSATLGATILCFDELASTNETARELAVKGASEGVSVIARKQTAGKGRQGRSWSSPIDEGLYVSIILRPHITPAQASVIPLASAIAVAETFAVDFSTAVDIKWPNDVLMNGRKICGILVESAIESGLLHYAILGIGINIAQKEFPDELRATATSLFLETQKTLTPEDFLRPLLARLNCWYPLAISQPEKIIERWQQLSSYTNACEVRIISGGAIIEGVTKGLTASGALLVELANGERREIVSGEVSLRKATGDR